MSDLKTAITVTCMAAIVLILLFALCHYFQLLAHIQTWINSTREEKIGLTKLKGHYNANGVFVRSDSSLFIGSSGSFKRFESVDNDVKFTSSSFNLDKSPSEPVIPPQPLRPAPVPISSTPKPITTITTARMAETTTSTSTSTSIAPIPRPVSSLNMKELANQNSNQFPVCLAPPPSPLPFLNGAQKLPTITAKAPLFTNIEESTSSHSHTTVIQEEPETVQTSLKRAVSCESVCSDTSVALGDLEEPNITGYLCIGLEYDSECADLIVNVLEAKDLIGPGNEDNLVDSYVRVFLLPDKDSNSQTKVYRSSNSPSYKERFLFALYPTEQNQRALCFHIYCTDKLSHTLIGEGELRLSDISLRQPVTTWVTLTETGQQNTEFGELMFSLSYLPTAERLTVVVVKARNLKFQNDKIAGDPFVKVYLLQQGKKIHKKKTSSKKADRSPIFNEAMIFSVPAHTLQTIQLRLTVAESPIPPDPSLKAYSIGHVIVGAQANGRPLTHWNQMLTALRKPVAMWHPLRK